MGGKLSNVKGCLGEVQFASIVYAGADIIYRLDYSLATWVILLPRQELN